VLPSLNHPQHSYTAVDSVGRVSELQVYLRVQAAARHAFRLQMALACSDGPEQLQQEVRCSTHGERSAKRIILWVLEPELF